MKKTKFIGALALASCVMLSGCNKKPEEETPKEIEVIIQGLPEVAIVGQEYDLDQYVTIKNSSESYTIEVASESASKASVSGHKVTVLDEGEIKFLVKLGDLSAEGSVEGRSAIRQTLIDLQKGMGHEYTVFDLGQEDVILHGDGYIQTQYWEKDEQSGEPLPGGFLKFPNHDGVYPYTEYVEDVVEEEPVWGIEIDSAIYSNSMMEYYNSDVTTDFSNLKTLVRGFDASIVEEGAEPIEVLTLSGEAAIDFAENSFFLPNGEYHFHYSKDSQETYAAPVTKLEFTVEDIGTEEAPILVADVLAFARVIDTSGEEPAFVEEFVNEYYMTIDPTMVGDELVEEALSDPENIPQGDGYNLLFKNYFETVIPGNSSFVASYEYGWFSNPSQTDPYGHFMDPESDEFEEFFAAEVSETIFEDAPVGYADRIFAENGIFNVEYKQTIVQEQPVTIPEVTSGIVQKVEVVEEEKVVTGVYEVEKGETGYEVFETSKYASIYEDSSLSLAGLGSALTSNALVLKGINNVGSQESPVQQYVFSLNPYEGYAFMDALLKSDSGLSGLVGLFNKYASRMDLRSFFDTTIMIVPSYGAMGVQMSLPWDEAGLYSYVVSFSISYNPSFESYLQTFMGSLDYPSDSEE